MNKRIGDFELGRTIGKGTFGKVKEGIHVPTGVKVAIKVLEKKKIADGKDLKRVERQLKLLRVVNHYNIIKLLQMHQNQKNIYIITELVEGDEMFNYISRKGSLSQEECRIYLIQLLKAVKYLHSNNICHRDIKPQNILIHQNTLILIDFGLSIQLDSTCMLGTSCGSPCYAAPQMLTGQKYNGKKSDVWAIGITLYAMVCGKLPFEHTSTQKLYQVISKGTYQQPNTSQPLQQLISLMIEIDPLKRPTIDEILKHPWISPTHQQLSQQLNYNWNDSILDSMSKMFNYSVENIKNIIINNQISSIRTYYTLITSKMVQKCQTTSLEQEIKLHEGGVHLNYIFKEYQECKKYIDNIFPNNQQISKHLFMSEGTKIEIKRIKNNPSLLYLTFPFYAGH